MSSPTTFQSRPIGAFFAAGDVLHQVLGRDALRIRWAEPSALDRMSVGDLAGHTARAVLTVAHYLDAVEGDPVRADEAEQRVDAPGYVVTLLGAVGDDLDDPRHVAVRERSAEEAADGVDALRTRVAEALADLRNRVPPIAGSLVRVADGLIMGVGDYLVTRVLELVVHLDDLAVSLDEPIDLPDDAAEFAVTTLAEVARRRHGTPTMVAQLARRERITAPVTAL